MVHIRQPLPLNSDGAVNIDQWIAMLHIPNTALSTIKNACDLAKLTGEDQSTRFGSNCFLQGLELAEILSELHMDAESIATAIIYSTAKNTDLSIEDIAKELGRNISTLTAGVLKLSSINLTTLQQEKQSTPQLDNIRKMLLAMVQDVRVVVIKLAEHLSMMREQKKYTQSMREHLAHETMNIFAPLANRLGLHQIKWELEDLAFFALEPDTYKSIAKKLDERRIDREERVQTIIQTLKEALKKAHIQADIHGRAKHIYSIKRKMTRKNLDFSQIYDAIAVRILVPTIEDSYQALSIVHKLWQHVPEEFDDYIATPKPNGYQSIHTALMDENNKHFEIQIRTHEMHETSELGVAAHWVYKEGKQQKSGYEEKITWLRQLLEWQKELSTDQTLPERLEKNIFEDRIYVFTPTNDIIDLPTGATPLDFAYHIHTQVGHRCRGAKVNDKIVPLTYHLNMGDKIEVLTAPQPNPSRDWALPQKGYLKTAGARAKILQWFKRQDYKLHIEKGRHLLDKELQRLHLDNVNIADIAAKADYKAVDLMLAALGNGSLRLARITQVLESFIPTDKIQKERALDSAPSKIPDRSHNFDMQGINNLLSKIAKCCKPIPGDPIIGYITKGQGITIHHAHCKNIEYAKIHSPDRLTEVSWNQNAIQKYPVDIELIAQDTSQLFNTLTTILANEKITLRNLQVKTLKRDKSALVSITIEIIDLEQLDRVLTQLQQIPQVYEVKRIMHT